MTFPLFFLLFTSFPVKMNFNLTLPNNSVFVRMGIFEWKTWIRAMAAILKHLKHRVNEGGMSKENVKFSVRASSQSAPVCTNAINHFIQSNLPQARAS